MRTTKLRVAGGWICTSCRARARACAVPITSQARRLPQIHTSTGQRKPDLPNGPARTRFAPSPTGSLHLGSIRTALFSYLLARRTGGQFVLRIEDTDQRRTIPGAEERLCEDLAWAGLNSDEGPVIGGPYGPYRQSERTSIYHSHAQTLLQEKKAYRCFCSAERMDQLNRLRHQNGLPLGYDRKCLNISTDEAQERVQRGDPHVIRFRAPQEWPRFKDLVYGQTGHGVNKSKNMQHDQPVYEDAIMLKSDGHPTYHLANVVDDQLMKITHVIRGSEWMASTPLHIALYEAFGWIPPSYGHVALLVDHNGQKLSKRNLDTDIVSYRNGGYFPEALANFAALLGWSHRQKKDVMDLQELESIFNLKFTRGNTIVSFDKLKFLQDQHAKRRIAAAGEAFEQMIRDVAAALLDMYGAARIVKFVGKRRLRDVVAAMLQAKSILFHSPVGFAKRMSLFLTDDTTARRPLLGTTSVSLLPLLRVCAATLCLVPDEIWTEDTHRNNLAQLEPSFAQISGSAELTPRQMKSEMYQYLRWALLGGATGPGIPETMVILGPEICNERIRRAALVTKEMETAASKPHVLTGFKSSQFAAAA